MRDGCDKNLQVGFFFQAEDGIRDVAVTGVQTCALPIFVSDTSVAGVPRPTLVSETTGLIGSLLVQIREPPNRSPMPPGSRSEERRVGKEGRSRWSTYH